MGEAHTLLGLFDKNWSYREHKKFYLKHNEYDPTVSKSNKHFELAAKAFEENGDYWGVSKALFSMGNAYDTDNNNINRGLKYSESLTIYQSDKNVFVSCVHPHNPAFESYEVMVQSFIKKYYESGL